MQNIENMQNMQNMQSMQNMHNISPLFFLIQDLWIRIKYQLADLSRPFGLVSSCVGHRTSRKSQFQVQLCAHKLKTDVSPDSAAEVLILADRHCLNSLKQVSPTCSKNLKSQWWLWEWNRSRLMSKVIRFKPNNCTGGDVQGARREDKILGKPKV